MTILIIPTTNQFTFCILFFPFIDILLRQLLLSLDQTVATDVGFILQQTLPSHIHCMGSVCLRYLGE